MPGVAAQEKIIALIETEQIVPSGDRRPQELLSYQTNHTTIEN